MTLKEANYRESDDAQQCANCFYFDPLRHEVAGRGICKMFGQIVKGNYVCDKWKAIRS